MGKGNKASVTINQCPIPNPQSPIPNPQFPIPNPQFLNTQYELFVSVENLTTQHDISSFTIN
jgi:hypothetical protein